MKTLDAAKLKQLFISGANNLYNHYPEIDQLNVFPVPDGDTGMNMNLTITSGAKEIQNRPEDDDLYAMASAFSRGLLMGARGNSGVITSQIFKGFSNALKDKKTINAKDLAVAWLSARDVAYKAVLKPVEGTILTVIRQASEALEKFVKNSTSIEDAMDYFYEQANISLQGTPDLLPILKEVGVVDSGGAGLCRLIEGMVSASHGKVIERNADAAPAPAVNETVSAYAGAKLSEDEEGYGYCTQFIIRLGTPEQGKKNFVEKNFIKFMSAHGKSLVTVRDEDIVKVHVHTLTPGNMLNYAQQFGEFVTITIENMSEEHDNISRGDKATDYSLQSKRLEPLVDRSARKPATKIEEPAPAQEEKEPEINIEKEIGLVAVSSGAGLDEMFRELGADVLVSGGQTMNPSTEDFVRAVKKTHARHVFILPNNSNIILAATQAISIFEGTDVDVKVISSKTIPQGMTAAMNYSPEGEADEIFEAMTAALDTVTSGSVTYAIKDTDIEGVHITKDFYMAMKNKNIVSCVKDKLVALSDLINAIVDSDSAILTILLGQDVTAEEEKEVIESVTARYGDDLEIDVRRGDQPVYSFLVGLE